MPIYEYACENCGQVIESFQGINDAPLTLCEKCGQPSLVKLVSAASFRLKGGGWYETDFKKEGDKQKNLLKAENDSGPEPSTSSTAIKTDEPKGASTTPSDSNQASASKSVQENKSIETNKPSGNEKISPSTTGSSDSK